MLSLISLCVTAALHDANHIEIENESKVETSRFCVLTMYHFILVLVLIIQVLKSSFDAPKFCCV